MPTDNSISVQSVCTPDEDVKSFRLLKYSQIAAFIFALCAVSGCSNPQNYESIERCLFLGGVPVFGHWNDSNQITACTFPPPTNTGGDE